MFITEHLVERVIFVIFFLNLRNAPFDDALGMSG